MNDVLARCPRVKVSSLPRFTSNGREIELSVRGDPQGVTAGMAILTDAVSRLGYTYTPRQ